MKVASHIAAGLLGIAFVLFGALVLFNLAPPPPPFPEGSAPAHFMEAFAKTGYLKFVKAFEVLGGLLILIPATRRAGLLVLGPILVNILAYHAFVMNGEGLFSPILGVFVGLTLFVTWTEREAFLAFLKGRRVVGPASAAGGQGTSVSQVGS